MIVTSDSTAVTEMSIDARTGRPTLTKLLAARALGASPRPRSRPATTNTKTGITIVPNAPRGSRRNIFSSIHVSFQSPRSIIFFALVADRVASQFDKDVFKVRKDCAEIRDSDPIFGETMNHLSDEIVALTTNGELRVAADHRLDTRDGSKELFGGSVVRAKDDCSLGAVSLHEVLRSVYVDNASVLDDGHPIAQAFGLLHEMSSQENGLAALANAAHQIPNRAPRLRVQPRCQFVEKHDLRIVDQRKRDEQSLLLAAREGHEPGIPLVDKAKLFEQPFAVCGILPVKGSPQVYRFPNFDRLLQLRLLELNPNPLLQFVHVAEGIQAEH